MRTIEFCFDGMDLQQMREATNVVAVETALGYLTSWNMNIGHVRITMTLASDCAELCASYYRDGVAPSPLDGQRPAPVYVIGAVWHGDHFGFHS